MMRPTLAAVLLVLQLAVADRGDSSPLIPDSRPYFSPKNTPKGRAVAGGVGLRILPIGDSITYGEGSEDGNGYRLRLRENLSENQVTYVGTESRGTMSNGNYAAWPGQTVQYIADNIGPSLTFKPNVVLIHGGTNDMDDRPSRSKQGNDSEGVLERLRNMITEITDELPDAVILVAMIIPTCDPHKSTNMARYQSLLPGLTKDFRDDGKKVLAVDFTILPTSDLYDCIHPTDAGYQKMGEWWYDYIHQIPEDWITAAEGDGSENGSNPSRGSYTVAPTGTFGLVQAAALAIYGGRKLMIVSQLVTAALLLAASAQASFSPALQAAFAGEGRASSSPTHFHKGEHTRKEQGDEICASRGEKQWSGTIDVTDKRRLFYWFAESRDDPANDPVIVLIGGGPGSSSMTVLFGAVGPCTLRHDKLVTEPNERLAINNHASLLIIDQPASVGLSPLAPGATAPTADYDAAEDFQTFLNVFFQDIFPEKAHLPIHLVSGSYGGHFLPTYLHHIMQSRRYQSTAAFRGNITSMFIRSPLIDFGALALGTYELLCVSAEGKGLLDEDGCQGMREAFPECWRLRQHCVLSGDGPICKAMMDYCTEALVKPYTELDSHPLDLRKKCQEKDKLKCDLSLDAYEDYLNKPDILQGLGYPADYNYTAWNFAMRAAYVESGAVARSTAGEVGAILDAHREGSDIGDVRMLILGGRDDPTCNVPGNKLASDDIPWSGQADFRLRPWEALPDSAGHTGDWKAVADGRLAFIALDDAGHAVDGDQPEAYYNILNEWLRGGWQGE